jgi:hypothetical protein
MARRVALPLFLLEISTDFLRQLVLVTGTPQGDVIERILRHCGRWDPRPSPGDCAVHDSEHGGDGSDTRDAIRELTYVDEDTFWAAF